MTQPDSRTVTREQLVQGITVGIIGQANGMGLSWNEAQVVATEIGGRIFAALPAAQDSGRTAAGGGLRGYPDRKPSLTVATGGTVPTFDEWVPDPMGAYVRWDDLREAQP